MKYWKCNICNEKFPTDGNIEDEAIEHTITYHMDYNQLKGDEIPHEGCMEKEL